MLRILVSLLLVILLFMIPGVFAQQTVSLHSLLNEISDFESITKWATPSYTLHQASSYDRRSISRDKPGWFANDDYNQFIRKESGKTFDEYAMMDADGPGAVTRFWLTSLFKAGKLRFYFDNETSPSIEIPAYDLMKAGLNLGPALLNPHSSYEANGKGGSTLYLPLPYQKHCKITFEFTDSNAVKSPHYYQINYRTYAPDTKVKTFTINDLDSDRSTINKTESLLWLPPTYSGGKKTGRSHVITAHSEMELTLPGGAAAIRLLTLKITPAHKEDAEKAFRSVVLKIEFDGYQTVWSPVGDFAGGGYGGKMINSWYRTLDQDGLIISRWIMPYQKSAKIYILNKADFPVQADVTAVVDDWKWDSLSMYFHTSFKYEENVKDAKWDFDVTKIASQDSSAPIEWNFIRIKGRGIYLGNTLSVYNHMHAWYGEGDAKVWVDDDTFPSEFGTGLEDYYNTSWAPVVLYQTPFANAPRADNKDSYGYNTFTRTRNLDGIPFKKSFIYNLEMISWVGGTIDCAATVYWYGFPEASTEGLEK